MVPEQRGLMKRRDFLGALSVAAAMRPVASLAQKPERTRRIGVLYGTTADDASARSRPQAFLEAPQKLGWVDGDNVRIDVRWGEGKPERLEQQAAELIKLSESPSMSHFGREQRSDPIDANGSFRRYSPLV